MYNILIPFFCLWSNNMRHARAPCLIWFLIFSSILGFCHSRRGFNHLFIFLFCFLSTPAAFNSFHFFFFFKLFCYFYVHVKQKKHFIYKYY